MKTKNKRNNLKIIDFTTKILHFTENQYWRLIVFGYQENNYRPIIIIQF